MSAAISSLSLPPPISSLASGVTSGDADGRKPKGGKSGAPQDPFGPAYEINLSQQAQATQNGDFVPGKNGYPSQLVQLLKERSDGLITQSQLNQLLAQDGTTKEQVQAITSALNPS
jgi:hypothetical protein